MTLLNPNYFLVITKAELCLKGTFVKVSFISVTIFLDIYEDPRRKNFINPSCPKHKIIEIKNDIIFIFTLFVVPQKGFIFLRPRKEGVRIKNLHHFSVFLHWDDMGRDCVLLNFQLKPFVSSTLEIHKNNIDTFRVNNKQYYKIILF